MGKLIEITVSAKWDDEASVWVATCDEIPGLIIEASTPDEIKAELRMIVPDEVVFKNLIEANVRTAHHGRTIKAIITTQTPDTTHATKQIKTRTTAEIALRASRLARASLAATI